MNSLATAIRNQSARTLTHRVATTASTTCVRPTAAIRHYATVRKEHTSTSRTVNFVLGTGLLVGGVVGLSYAFDSRASIHKYAIIPLIHWTMDAETAHKVAIKCLKMGLSPWDTQEDDASLEVKVRCFFLLLLQIHKDQEAGIN